MPKNVTNKKDNKKKNVKSTKTNVSTKKVQPELVKETKKVEVVKEVKEEKVVEKKKNKKNKTLGIKGYINKAIERLKNDIVLTYAVCICIVLLAALILVLCEKRIPKTSEGTEILASLNGKNITADDLYLKLKDDNGTDALIEMIDDYIADKEVTSFTDEDKEYAQQIVDYYSQYAEYYGTDLKTFLESYVGLSGIEDEDDFYDFVLKDYKKSLAVINYVADNASEEDLKKYYEENYSDKLTARHILIEVDEDNGTTEEDAYNKAVELINTLNETDSEDLEDTFKTLAEENSDDTATYSDGGLLEDFTKSSVVEEFWNAAYDLEDGEYTTEPVKSSYGYHVILKESSTPVEEYEDIKDSVKKAYAKNLLSNDSNLQIQKWGELRKEYKLSINDDVIKEAYEKTLKEASSDDSEESSEDTTEE